MEALPTAEELRGFEREVKRLFLAKKIRGPVHLSGGNERPLLEIFQRVQPEDWVFSTHRYHYHYLLKGGKPDYLLLHLMHECTIHLYDRGLRFFTSAIVGGCLPIAVGTALAIKRRGGKERVWCFVGDGATDSGRLFDALRYAASFDLPKVFIEENNNLS